MNKKILIFLIILIFSIISCSKSSKKKKAEPLDPIPAIESTFLFNLESMQFMSEAPFPNDIYLNESGTVSIKPLEEDPVIKELADEDTLKKFSGYIAEKKGFGFSSAVHFFMNENPDLDSFKDKIKILTLEGPEFPKELNAQYRFYEPAKSLSVFYAYGEYMMPSSVYAVLIEKGVKSVDGKEISMSPNFARLIAQYSSEPKDDKVLKKARESYKKLRDYINENDLYSKYIIGTIFTTEEVLEYSKVIFDNYDSFDLQPLSFNYMYNKTLSELVKAEPVEGEELDDYFGTTESPYENMPGAWNYFNREWAGLVDENSQNYEGGVYHNRIYKVINASYIAPVLNFKYDDNRLINKRITFTDSGKPESNMTTMIPFSLFLCEGHKENKQNIPVAIFNHGGTAIRSDAIAYANLNCNFNIATIAPDMLYHSGRTVSFYSSEKNMILPAYPDNFNAYTNKSSSDEGYKPDYIGDQPDGVLNMGPLLGLSENIDPMVIEANLFTVSLDTYMLVRYIKEADFSILEQGLSFNKDKMFHNSLSLGTGFTTSLHAMRNEFVGIINSVGTGHITSLAFANSPNYHGTIIMILNTMFGTETNVESLIQGPYGNLILSLHQWLYQRSDPIAHAPYVIRHRIDNKNMNILSFGDSWDETLYIGAQLTYNNALGLPVYTNNNDFVLDKTVPGGDSVNETLISENGISDNVEFNSTIHTVGSFFNKKSCHGQSVECVCNQAHVHPYPPFVDYANEDNSYLTPICQLHNSSGVFIKSILNDNPIIKAPFGSCDELY